MPTAFIAAMLLVLTIGCASGRASDDEPRATAVAEDTVVRVVEPKPAPPRLRLVAPAEPAPEPVVNEAMFACASAADCAVIEMGCCDPCNGGYLLAVNRMHTEQVRQSQSAQDCSASACEQNRCDVQAQAVCADGECARIEQHPLGAVGAQITVIRNSFAPR